MEVLLRSAFALGGLGSGFAANDRELSSEDRAEGLAARERNDPKSWLTTARVAPDATEIHANQISSEKVFFGIFSMLISSARNICVFLCFAN